MKLVCVIKINYSDLAYVMRINTHQTTKSIEHTLLHPAIAYPIPMASETPALELIACFLLLLLKDFN